jgi:hypothetical protein
MELQMNIILHTKIETCLELCTNAADFKKKVLKVTGMSPERFKGLYLTDTTFQRLENGDKATDILRELF